MKASLGTTPENLSCEARYQVHSNSIKSLELVHLSDTVSLLAAGGDDNGLSLSLLETGSEVNARSPVTTISIPDAHAASVTAVKVLNRRHAETAANASTILIASSGNDHRVKIWSIHVDLHRNGPERIDVKNVVDEYSNVADISSLDMVQEDGVLGGSRLLVCGVGMEMLNIRADVL